MSVARRSQSSAIQVNGSRATSRAAIDVPSREDPLQPLRAMADRVGKEVERFAEIVDHWHTHGNEDEKSKYQSTLDMVGKFKDFAETSVKELKKENDAENKGLLNKSVRRRVQTLAEMSNQRSGNDNGISFQSLVASVESNSTPDPASVQELRQWQAELATWDLVRIIIEHYHPEPGTDIAEKKQKLVAAGREVSHYTPNSEIWDRFLLQDDQAKEKQIILRWLEKTAESSESAVESITEQLKAQSGKDTSTWTSGWLDTKSRLKQAKRMQGLDHPVHPTTNLKTSGEAKRMVTHLDPDAPTRQNGDLEKSDDYYERALWMVIYEMMRRGSPWEEIAEWCKERNEAWRGVSIGAAYESHPDGGPNVAGPTAGYLFRRTSFYAAKGARSPYEAAVYGLLSGHLESVEKVARTWDDYLYARYNSLLLSRFDEYLQDGPNPRVTQHMGRQFVFEDEVAKLGDWNSSSELVIDSLKKQKSITLQSLSPMKLIQGSLISRSVDELVYQVGTAIAILLQGDDRPVNLMIDPESNPRAPTPKPLNRVRVLTVDPCYESLATDPNGLRILAHVFIVLRRGLRLFDMDIFSQWAAMDNVILAYIEVLRISKEMSLIPLYAAQLDGTRPIHCLARILPDIKNVDEQESCIKLMELYRIDVIEVVTESCSLALKHTGLDAPQAKSITRYEILERTAQRELLWPSQRIKCQLPGLDTTHEEDALIASLQWWLHIGKENERAWLNLEAALVCFLLHGRIGAAEKLITELSIEALSMTRTQALCGYPFDFTQPGTEEQDEIQVTQYARKSIPSRSSLRLSEIPNAEEHMQRVLNFRQLSSTYCELQQLVRIIVFFREWRAEQDALMALQREGAKVNTKRIKDLFDAIQATIGPILDSFTEAAPGSALWDILKAYLPEVVIAYISVVQTASFFIHRDSAVKAMEIATIVADEDKKWLQKLFLDTGRMTELVDTLALVSRAMVHLSELGEAKKIPAKKRGNRGETLKIWDLKSRN